MAEVVELSERKQRKFAYAEKLKNLVAEYKNILIIGVDFVGSNQLQQVRLATRGTAVILMGKNTIMRKVLTDLSESNPDLLNILPYVRGNIGFVFTNGDLAELRKLITSNKVPAGAKTGVVAPSDVFIPPGPTPLDPGQTNFFQALNIATKISRGAIEIVSKVHLIREGEKVSASAVALLSKLNIRPFFYGITVNTVYENGSVYDACVLDLSQADILNKFFAGVNAVAALGLAAGYPNLCSLRHSIVNAFKYVLSVSLATDYTFEEAKIFKEYLENPDAFAPAVEEKADEAEDAGGDKDGSSSSDDDDDDDSGGFDLFD